MSVVASGHIQLSEQQARHLYVLHLLSGCLGANHSSKTEGIQEWPRSVVPAPDNIVECLINAGDQLAFGCGMVVKYKCSGWVASKH